jgi:DNA-binding CsgD family transcriptional regulator
MASLAAVAFAAEKHFHLTVLPDTQPHSQPRPPVQHPQPTARESGVAAVIALFMIYYVITLMAMYIGYQETTVARALYGAGGIASIAAIIVIMLVFNRSALHLWSLCLVCSVLGIGALHYTPAFLVDGGSLLYGAGEGLGFMVILYLLGGALKRAGSFRLLKLWCAFACLAYFAISGIFYAFYERVDAPNLALAFPAVLVLALVCFLFSPVLQEKLFSTDWTDGYHMADMPAYSQALQEVEQANEADELGLTPREMEVLTMLMTEASPKQIAATLGVSYATVNFHSKNLYRKLDIQSRTELFARYQSSKH